MQAITILLVLISIGTMLAPVGAAIAIYHNDLSQLVITSQIKDIMNGNSSIFPTHSQQNDNSNPNEGNSGLSGLLTPTLVSVQSNVAEESVTAIFSVTNTLNYDLTLKSFSTDLEFNQGTIQAGSISLSSPVTANAGETTQLSLSGHWTQAAQDYIINNLAATTVDDSVSNVVININGIILQSAGIIQIGDVPMNWQG